MHSIKVTLRGYLYEWRYPVAKRKKTQAEELEKLRRIMVRLTRKYSPDVIQGQLANVYDEYSVAGESEAEVEFWLKCHRASANLADGMNKWAHEMVEDMLEEEE